MLVNRVGDLGLVLAIASIFLTFKTLDYSVVFALSSCAVDMKTSFLSLELDRSTIIAFYSLVLLVNLRNLVFMFGYQMLWKDQLLFRP